MPRPSGRWNNRAATSTRLAQDKRTCPLQMTARTPPARAKPNSGELGNRLCAHRVSNRGIAATDLTRSNLPAPAARRFSLAQLGSTAHTCAAPRPQDITSMPETMLAIPGLLTQDDADAVMFQLQDLPCVNRAEVDLQAQRAWVDHTAMISVADIAAALLEAGYEVQPLQS